MSVVVLLRRQYPNYAMLTFSTEAGNRQAVDSMASDGSTVIYPKARKG
jgi:hypothetical protein